jgi:serine phosphatase RsbU (regulator of sigma subunit)/PAS domain-containing protein
MREVGADLALPGDDWGAPAWDVLKIITSSSADGITIQDASGTLIYANDAAARMSGFASGQDMQRASTEEIVGRFEILDEEGRPLPVGELPGRRAFSGEREPEAVVRFRRRSGGEDRCARRQAQAFLVSATQELSRSLNWEATVRRVARLAVPDLADWCAVDVLEADGSLSLIALAHVDPAKVDWAHELRRRFPTQADDPSGVAHVVRTGVSELIPEVTQELIDAAHITDPELLGIVERLRLSSVMTIPLIARGRTLGALTMVWAESGKHYTEDDLRLGEDLASRAAIAIDNARLYRERDHIARSLQERLLPKKLPRIPGVDVAARYLPAGDVLQAGGDFYDLFEMDDGSWKAVIGDVCGKGPEAAALMGFVRFTTRAASRQDTKPSEALVKLNKALLEELEAGKGEFCTAAVVRIRPQDEGVRLTIAVAGHPLPLVVRANGDVEEAGIPGTLLGMFEEIDVSEQIVDLHAGDALVMLTDGVLEAGRDPVWEGTIIPRLLSTCTDLSPDAIADRIKAAVADLDDRRTDDVAVLVMKVRA